LPLAVLVGVPVAFVAGITVRALARRSRPVHAASSPGKT
jgi:hypothetical protein